VQAQPYTAQKDITRCVTRCF